MERALFGAHLAECALCVLHLEHVVLVKGWEAGVLFLEGVVLFKVSGVFGRSVAVLAFGVLTVLFNTGLAAVLLHCVETLLFAAADIIGILDS